MMETGYGMCGRAKLASKSSGLYQVWFWKKGYNGPACSVRLAAGAPIVLYPYAGRAEINALRLSNELEGIMEDGWLLEIQVGSSHDEIESGGGSQVFMGSVMSVVDDEWVMSIRAEAVC